MRTLAEIFAPGWPMIFLRAVRQFQMQAAEGHLLERLHDDALVKAAGFFGARIGRAADSKCRWMDSFCFGEKGCMGAQDFALQRGILRPCDKTERA